MTFTTFCFKEMAQHKKPGPKPKQDRATPVINRDRSRHTPARRARPTRTEQKKVAALLTESLDRITRRYIPLDEVRGKTVEQLREMCKARACVIVSRNTGPSGSPFPLGLESPA